MIKLLYNPRVEGGLNLPNLELYQVAAQAFYIDRIINKTNEDPWIDIENNQLQGNSLLFALFSKNNVKSTNFVINSTIIAWNKIKKNLHQEIRLPRHIAIWKNPSINIEGTPLYWETCFVTSDSLWIPRFIYNTVVFFRELKSEHNLNDTEFFRYMQLKNWIILNFDLGKNTIPEISNIFKTVKNRRLIGFMYNLLTNSENSDTLLEKIYKWTEDLGRKMETMLVINIQINH